MHNYYLKPDRNGIALVPVDGYIDHVVGGNIENVQIGLVDLGLFIGYSKGGSMPDIKWEQAKLGQQVKVNNDGMVHILRLTKDCSVYIVNNLTT